MYNAWTHLAPRGQKHEDEDFVIGLFIPMLLSSWYQMCPRIVHELAFSTPKKINSYQRLCTTETGRQALPSKRVREKVEQVVRKRSSSSSTGKLPLLQQRRQRLTAGMRSVLIVHVLSSARILNFTLHIQNTEQYCIYLLYANMHTHPCPCLPYYPCGGWVLIIGSYLYGSSF